MRLKRSQISQNSSYWLRQLEILHLRVTSKTLLSDPYVSTALYLYYLLCLIRIDYNILILDIISINSYIYTYLFNP